jgi:hypothetical protein
MSNDLDRAPIGAMVIARGARWDLIESRQPDTSGGLVPHADGKGTPGLDRQSRIPCYIEGYFLENVRSCRNVVSSFIWIEGIPHTGHSTYILRAAGLRFYLGP